MKKYLLILCLVLVPFTVWAQKVLPPIDNTTFQPMGGSDTSGDAQVLLINGDGSLSVKEIAGGGGATNLFFTDILANATGVIKASAGKMFSFSCTNSNASERWIQFHQKATDPVNPEVPFIPFSIKPGTTTVIGTDFFTDAGLDLATGVSFCFSSTEATCTPGAGAEKTLLVVYQ